MEDRPAEESVFVEPKPRPEPEPEESKPIVLYYGHRSTPNGKGQSFDSMAEEFEEDFSKDAIKQEDGTVICQLTCRFCKIRIGARGDLLRNHIKCMSHTCNKSKATCPVVIDAEIKEIKEEKDEESAITTTNTAIKSEDEDIKPEIQELASVKIELEEQIPKGPQLRLILEDVKEKLVKCEICSSMFLSLSELRDHEKKSHNKYKCSRCNSEAGSGEEYRVHMSLHEYFNPCICNECGQSFVNYTCLGVHDSQKHGKLLLLQTSKPNAQKFQSNTNAAAKSISSSLAELKLDVVPDPTLDQKSSSEKNQENPNPDPQKQNLQNPVSASALQDPKELIYPRKKRKNHCIDCNKFFETRSSFLVHFMFSHADSWVLNWKKKQKTHHRKKAKKSKARGKTKTKSDFKSKVNKKANTGGLRVAARISASKVRQFKPQAGFCSKLEVIHEESETEATDPTPMALPVIALPSDDESSKSKTETAVVAKAHNSAEAKSSSTRIRELRSRICKNKDKSKPKPLHSAIVRLKNIGKNMSKQCQICHQSVRLGDLKQHIDFHVRCIPRVKGRKPCSLCNFSASKPVTIRDHMYSVHFGLKPYKCNFCRISYSGHAAFQYHLVVVHQTNKKFECKDCGQCFTKKDRLARHIRQFHGGSGSHFVPVK